MVRVREIKEKFHPNQKFRAWKASHTFGGTTKTKSLYVLGFRRKNFYYVAAAAGAILLIAAIAGGLGFRASMRKAKVVGAREEAVGQLVETQVTERRTRVISSGGRTFLTTEVTTFETTVQRGGGATLVEVTGENGQRITVPGFKTYVPNSDGGVDLKTLLGSTIAVTNTDGATISTVLFGRPTAITDGSGDVSTGTIFPGLTVITGSDGSVVTSLSIAAPAPPAPSISVGDFTTTIGGVASTGKSTSEVSTNDDISPSRTSGGSSSSTTSRAASSSSPVASTSSDGGSGGGDGGELFDGEATFYAPGLGSCGIESTEADYVAALSKVLFDATGATNSNNNPYCGRKALVKAAGKARRGKRFVDDKTRANNFEESSRAWYSGNITRPGVREWEKSRIEKESRRGRIRQEDMSPPQPSKEDYTLQKSWPTDIPKWGELSKPPVTAPPPPPPSPPVITPPPSLRIDKRQAGGGGVTITVVDRCPVCKQYDLDLSPAAFDLIGDQAEGRVEIQWRWLD